VMGQLGDLDARRGQALGVPFGDCPRPTMDRDRAPAALFFGLLDREWTTS